MNWCAPCTINSIFFVWFIAILTYLHNFVIILNYVRMGVLCFVRSIVRISAPSLHTHTDDVSSIFHATTQSSSRNLYGYRIGFVEKQFAATSYYLFNGSMRCWSAELQEIQIHIHFRDRFFSRCNIDPILRCSSGLRKWLHLLRTQRNVNQPYQSVQIEECILNCETAVDLKRSIEKGSSRSFFCSSQYKKYKTM